MELIDKAWLQAEITRHFEIMVMGDDINDVVCAIRGKDLKAIIDKAPTFKNFEVVVRCKDCKHRPIWEMGRIDKFAEAPIIDETTVADFLKKSQKKTRRDYTCPYLWDAEGYYEMPEDDFFCKYGEK